MARRRRRAAADDAGVGRTAAGPAAGERAAADAGAAAGTRQQIGRARETVGTLGVAGARQVEKFAVEVAAGLGRALGGTRLEDSPAVAVRAHAAAATTAGAHALHALEAGPAVGVAFAWQVVALDTGAAR